MSRIKKVEPPPDIDQPNASASAAIGSYHGLSFGIFDKKLYFIAHHIDADVHKPLSDLVIDAVLEGVFQEGNQ